MTGAQLARAICAGVIAFVVGIGLTSGCGPKNVADPEPSADEPESTTSMPEEPSTMEPGTVRPRPGPMSMRPVMARPSSAALARRTLDRTP